MFPDIDQAEDAVTSILGSEHKTNIVWIPRAQGGRGPHGRARGDSRSRSFRRVRHEALAYEVGGAGAQARLAAA